MVDSVFDWRRDLHQIPELGFQERETSQYLRDVLEHMGIDVVVHAETGLVAEISGRGPGPLIALRADMDGLPLHEESGEPFSSRHEGIMHACGHDVHMAVLLGTAKRLVQHADFPGRIRLLFQPSEEGHKSGARALIEAGALKGVQGVIGLHVWSPLPVGTIGIRPGPFMAAADGFTIVVKGRGGHGSEPDTAQDSILIASQIVVNLQQVVSRRVSPLEPCVLSVGTFQGGTASNIIAETTRLSGTVRSFSTRVGDVVEREVRNIAEATAALHGATVAVDYHRGLPAVINDASVIRAWQAAIEDAVEIDAGGPYMGSEDFAYYLNEVAGAFIFLGGRPDDGEQYPHHSPHFRVSERCLPIGVEVMERGARALLTHPVAVTAAKQ